MTTEKGLYAQVFMIHRKDSDNKNLKEETKKFNFERQSSRSIHWFDLYSEWLEKNSGHVNRISIDFFYQTILGVRRQKHILYL